MKVSLLCSFVLAGILLAGLAILVAPAHAQDEEEEPFQSGLIADYTDAMGRSAQRIDREVRFVWSRHAPDERLAAGKFRARWRGFLMSQADGTYQLHVHAAGKVRVQLRGETVLSGELTQPGWLSSRALDLSFDYHPLEIEFESLAGSPRMGLYWTGPQFQLEPVSGRQLFHDRTASIPDTFGRGARLVAALRCAACHVVGGGGQADAAPALDHLAGNLHDAWLRDYLAERPATANRGTSDTSASELSRRMPYWQLKEPEIEAISAYLFAKSLPTVSLAARAPKDSGSAQTKSKAKRKKKTDESPDPPRTPREAGRELVHTVGCLACHRIDGVGSRGLYDGGDLTEIARKRPRDFFARWLAAPASMNAQHRMPLFELSDDEQRQIGLYLAELGTPPANGPGGATTPAELIKEGERLFVAQRCGACHVGPPAGAVAGPPSEAPTRTRLAGDSNWTRSCAGEVSAGLPGQPFYRLGDAERQAIQDYVSGVHPASVPHIDLASTLDRRNCLACHAREGRPGLAAQLGKLAERDHALAPRIPALTPPPLDSIGDKLHDGALREAIRRQGPVHRPYLSVRMPRFQLTDEELESLVEAFVTADRIPAGISRETSSSVAETATRPAANASSSRTQSPLLLEAVGSRLVTQDGFGCTSCHAVGSVQPAQAPLNARGPDLSMLGKRIRREWFDRWVRNPARIVPRMEMPSVQVAVRGVLQENLDSQLNAVWEVLNHPGFEPPEPNPVRVARQTGTGAQDRAIVITDVLRTPGVTWIKPLLIGLANRHNVLIDLETGRLAAWSVGDVARQRTEGKTWFWEAAGKNLFQAESARSDLELIRRGRAEGPQLAGQFVTEFDSLEHVGPALRFRHRLHFATESGGRQVLQVTQQFQPLSATAIDPSSGFRRTIEVAGLENGQTLLLHAGGDRSMPGGSLNRGSELLVRAGEGSTLIRLVGASRNEFQPDGSLSAKAVGGTSVSWELEYRTQLPVDHFPSVPPSVATIESAALQVVPGFEATRLPLTDSVMPTALAWKPDGTLVVASLKGQVFLAVDRDGDELADELQPFSDELAAPYGLFASADHIDVLNKYALLRLFDDDADGRADRTITLASGWGHTDDYHDWAVGLPRGDRGQYYMALPCQQDKRSPAAAAYRGAFLGLVPRTPDAANPHLFAIQPISHGHRFPMGIARNRHGDLFVTDNQGNYNPFNELNHIRQGAHFGFINANDKSDDPRPPLTAPAIDIPHPWTRSVNGICFLDTPAPVRERLGRPGFGPWEGHLIGCEMDTRRLVRMSLQPVGDSYQGAAYPFSFDQPLTGPPLLGPLVSAVSPTGDLYVGGLRDSGWGGANNVGEVVRLRLQPQDLPNGIAEMRATATGFEIDFVAPVNRQEASNVANFSLSSYTRESTPAYGGPDLNRRTESIARVELSGDGRRANLTLRELRAGFVYELHVRNLAQPDQRFFPAEAHYTLRQIPR